MCTLRNLQPLRAALAYGSWRMPYLQSKVYELKKVRGTQNNLRAGFTPPSMASWGIKKQLDGLHRQADTGVSESVHKVTRTVTELIDVG
jgi:hypothetical protein